MIKTIIIDDEKLARDLLKAYLKNQEQIDVVAECSNGFDGLKAIQEHQPDLIFLDIQMPKLTGFEMLELLDDRPKIIFSTAYDEFAIKAFEENAVDYLLKPFSQQRLEEALSKVRIDPGKDERISQAMTDARRDQELDRLVLRSGSQIIMLSMMDISYFEAQDDYVAIYSKGKKYLKQMRMKYLEDHLPEKLFCRTHRSYIVKMDEIDKLEAYSKDSYIALLKGGEKIPVSRSGYQLLRDRLNF